MSASPRGHFQPMVKLKGLHVCPKCGHVDLRGAPRLQQLAKLAATHRNSRALANAAHVSIQIASNAVKRLRDLGLLKTRVGVRNEGGVFYEW